MKPGALPARFVRGELPLEAYPWGGAALLGAVLLLSHVIVALAPLADSRAVAALLAVVPLALAALALAVVARAAWRSGRRAGEAQRHPGRTAAAVLAVTAQVVAGAVLLVWLGLPLLRTTAADFYASAAGPVFHVRPLGDAAVLVRGRIDFGLTAEVRARLDAHPAVRAVHLNSPGGVSVEAHRLHRLLAARGVTTVVREQCASACVIVLMAGRERLLAGDARVGVHRPHVAGEELPGLLAPRALRRVREEWIAAGMPPAFVDRALQVPARAMWHPTPEELLAYRVVTGLVPESALPR